MEITEELIQRYFLQECTSQERAAVSAWFYGHPEELDKYLADASWKQFESEETVPTTLSQQMLDNIHAQIQPSEPVITPMRRFNYRWLAAAASIVLVLGAGWVLLSHHSSAVRPVAAIVKAQTTSPVNDTISNQTSQAKEIALRDGSVVTLSPGSRIVFNKDFIQPHRDIQLNGEAIFKVAKDKTRPFTVFAGGLSTTALGTRFKVTAYNVNNKVRVMLYNGKVVIKQRQAGVKPMQDVYLTPGMQLMWERDDKIAQVSNFNNVEQNAEVSTESEGKTIIAGQMISFQNQSLEKVIVSLRSAFHINIRADDTLLVHHTYTGTVNLKTDAAGDVLKTIATLNGLTLTRQQDDYELTR